MKLSKRNFALASILALSPSMLYAQEIENRSNVYLGAVKYIFDDNHNQHNDIGFLVGFEQPISERWSMLIEHWDIDSDFRTGSGDADVTVNRLGANYHLAPLTNWQPYAGFGVGRVNIDRSGANTDTGTNTIDFGIGVKRQLSQNMLLKGDVRALKLRHGNGLDFALSLSLAYAFGGQASSPAPAPMPAPVEPQAPLDSDNDGVINSADRCPSTPAGRDVNASGCQLDDDRDGVVNALDNCPDTSAELAVDNNGCPILDASLMRQTLAVTFSTNQAEINADYDSEILQFAEFMEEYTNTTVVIEGHTDSDGAADYNQVLSERRAIAVMNELVEVYNIDASRLSAVGYGETQPTASNTTAAGKAQNRRIEAEVSVELEAQRLR